MIKMEQFLLQRHFFLYLLMGILLTPMYMRKGTDLANDINGALVGTWPFPRFHKPRKNSYYFAYIIRNKAYGAAI